MTVTTLRPWTIDGLDLQTLAFNIETIDGLFGRPAMRGENSPTPYLDGSYAFGKKFYQQRDLSLSMLVLATDANGVVTSNPATHLYDNLDVLLGLFESASLLSLKRTMGDEATQRELLVEVVRAIPVQTGISPLSYRFVVEMRAPRPFWRELPIQQDIQSNVTSFPHNYLIATGGNAPIADAVITIHCDSGGSNPSLTLTSTGEFIKVNDTLIPNDDVIIDLGARTFEKNGVRADSSISRNRAWFMRLPPNSPSLSLDFDADSGQYDVTIDWYDKWF